MTYYFLFILFLFGLIIGSFLNVLVLRYGKKRGASDGRSECMTCHKELSWYELLPVVSWLIQRGRCRGCKSKISWQYPLVEVFTGLGFTSVGCLYFFEYNQGSYLLSLGDFIGMIALLVAFAILVAIFVYDLYHQIIPDEWSFTFALSSLVYATTTYVGDPGILSFEFFWRLLAGFFLFLPFYLLWKVSDGRWIGLGDGKLAVGIGWLLGTGLGFSAIVYSFWLGAIFAIILLIIQKLSRKKSLTMKTAIAFGPFLIIGTLLTFWFQVNTVEFVDVVLAKVIF